ncbi:MAG: prepilin-type N-terminal cleavage/methylation domain-containing protein [Sedimentisphaerales bacterium]|nr:prepilin-type N-terminal cleavage/methylation domain-containing protein [Sedimentisphaerales bacterium]
MKRLSSNSDSRGFTLVELLVALSVSSIILAAVATLAYAMGAANDSTDDTSRKQAQVRYATMRVSELVRHCKLICFAGPDDFALWRADDNNDGRINISELVYVEKGASGDHLHLCDFPILWGWDPVIDLSDVRAYSTKWWLMLNMSSNATALIPQCSNVQFSFDVLPPQSRFVNISYVLTENNIPRQYQTSAFVRGWAGNILNDSGTALVNDDDQ